jgi:hypothetical protein
VRNRCTSACAIDTRWLGTVFLIATTTQRSKKVMAPILDAICMSSCGPQGDYFTNNDMNDEENSTRFSMIRMLSPWINCTRCNSFARCGAGWSSSVVRRLLHRCGHLQTGEQFDVAWRARSVLDLLATGPVGRGKFGPLLHQRGACLLLIYQPTPVARRCPRFAAATWGQVISRYFICSRDE